MRSRSKVSTECRQAWKAWMAAGYHRDTCAAALAGAPCPTCSELQKIADELRAQAAPKPEPARVERNLSCPAAGPEGCSVPHENRPHPVCPNCQQWQHLGRFSSFRDCLHECAQRGLAPRISYQLTQEAPR